MRGEVASWAYWWKTPSFSQSPQLIVETWKEELGQEEIRVADYEMSRFVFRLSQQGKCVSFQGHSRIYWYIAGRLQIATNQTSLVSPSPMELIKNTKKVQGFL